MRPPKEIRPVVLPAELDAWEVKTTYFGGSETQLSYAYYRRNKEDIIILSEDYKIPKLLCYHYNYWGNIEGVVYL